LRSFKKILVANRGEIAVRVIRACSELGIRTVAVYSDADREALHVRFAHEVVSIGPPPSNESYLCGDRIIAAAKTTGAEAIHPGYGFLAENADFARAVEEAGLIFLGPRPETIELLGDKRRARALAERVGVPVVPGWEGDPNALEEARRAAGEIGWPVLVKAALGGGGKGMTRVNDEAGLAEALEAAALPLYAQHVDGLDVATLIDIFRAEEDSCLLGTDAVRDGVDVPGRSLRLIVFDRVPWPRPTILHRARKKAFGGAAYDDRLTRLKLKQAYGRLVRRADDHGVFVLLDRAIPSRLLGAFPEGVEVKRVGLAEAVVEVAGFLSS